jgi:hypothetical protein
VRLVFIGCPVICLIFIFLSQLLWIMLSCLLWFRINWKSFQLWLDTLDCRLACCKAVYFGQHGTEEKKTGCHLYPEWLTNPRSQWLSGPRPYIAPTAPLQNFLFITYCFIRIMVVLLLILYFHELQRRIYFSWDTFLLLRCVSILNTVKDGYLEKNKCKKIHQSVI